MARKIDPRQTNFFALLAPPIPLSPNVVLLDDPRWPQCLQELQSAKYFGLDLEYYGPWSSKKDIDHTKAQIRLIQIGLPSGLTLIADLGSPEQRDQQLAKHTKFLQVLRPLLASRSVLKVGQSLKGDLVALECNLGLQVRAVRDLMLFSQVLWAGVGAAKPKKPKGRQETPEERQKRLKFVGLRHTLQAIAQRTGFGYVDKSEQASDWAGKLSNQQLNYAAEDAQIVLPIWKCLAQWVKEADLIDSVLAECEALPAFAECEVHGLPVDWATLNEAINKWSAARDKVLAVWKETFPVDPLKKEKVAVALSKALDLTGDDRLYSLGEPGKNGKRKILPRVNDETLIPYDTGTPGNSEAPPERRKIYEAVHAYLEHNSIFVQLKYLEGFRKHYYRGYVRSRYFQIAMSDKPGKEGETGKGMGRASAQNPNSQNSPNLQPAHKAAGLPHPRSTVKPKPGHSLILVDLAASHARIATQASLDPVLMDIFNSGKDVHCVTATGLLKQKGGEWTYEKTFSMNQQAKQYAKLLEKGLNPLPVSQECFEVQSTRALSKNVFYGCVPMDSLALTREGWRFYDQLSVNQEILAYNPESGRNEWTPIVALNVFDDAPIIDLSFGSKWKARSTPDHRWYGTLGSRIPGRYTLKGKGTHKLIKQELPYMTTTQTMPKAFRVKVSAPADGGPGLRDWRITAEKYTVDWVPFVLRMTVEERRAFLIGCLISEGHLTKVATDNAHQTWILSQNEGNLAEAMLLAAYLEGYKVSIHNEDGRYGKVWRMRLCRKEVVTGQQLQRTEIGRGRVWCPTTKFGTWVMRQGNNITITGNSINIQGAPTLKKTGETGAEPVFMSLEQAQEGITVWRQTYHVLHSFQRSTIKKANSHKIRFDQPGVGPYSLGLPGEYAVVRGLTNRRLFLLKEQDKHGRYSCKGTDCVSFVWMGTEADIIKRAMGRVLAEFDQNPEWGARFCGMAHDDVTVECLKQWENEVAQVVQREFDEAMRWVIKVIPVSDGDWKSTIVGSWAAK